MGNSKEGIPQLTGPNFENWRFRVKLHLDAVEVSSVLTEPAPAAAGDALTKWNQTDRKAKSILVGFVADEILEVVREKQTAAEMWKALEETYAKKSVSSQTLLRKQLARLRKKEGISMRAHFVAFDDLVRQLKTAGAKMEEGDLVAQLFLTLPDSYDPLVTALENLEEKDLKLETVKQRLLAEESKRADRQDDSSEDNGAAFVGGRKKQQKKFTGKCHRCGKVGHMQKDCRSKKPEGNANAAVGKKAVAFMANGDQKKSEAGKIQFCVDSGCSDHLVKDADHLRSMRKLKDPFIIDVAKNDVTLVGKYAGEIKGMSNKGVEFTIQNVVLLPDLRENLLSVKKLSQAGIDVLFTARGGQDRAEFKKDGELIGVAYLRGNMYLLDLDVVSFGQANISVAETSKLWHRRMGHASQQALNNLAKHEMTTGFVKKLDSIGFCDTCVMAKQCREPFDGVRERATRPLERIHSDVCGPIDPPAWDGSRYFVSFIDDWTHFAVIYTIKRKSEVFRCFKEYEAMATTQWQMKVCKLTVDQGREYFSNEQRNYYKNRGIQVQPTVAYSPQQNGVAERFNRTLVEKVRSILLDSKAPKTLWSEAALTATYLLNRSPTVALAGNVTPAEKWMNVKPDLDKLRIFGCKAMAWIPNQQRKKLDPKSREMVMIGYAPNGYRLWDKDARKIVIARDVKFNEECFPYAEQIEEACQVPLVVPILYEPEGEVLNNPEELANPDELPPEVPIEESDDEDPQEESEEEIFEETNPGALPSQQRSEDCPESTTRRSERERRLPGKLLDFFTGFRATSAAGTFDSTDPPSSYDEIEGRDDKDHWLAAVHDELESMENNKVWRMVKLPAGVKPLQPKWVFCVKEDADGNVVRHKARLVVKGFLQKPGLDYHETYAPVAKLTTIRTALAVALRRGLVIHQMDVKTAFLHGELQERIFMTVPDGIEADPDTVCQLQKSLYGLKQAPKCWNEKLNQVLLQLGFKRSQHDYCLYTRIDERGNNDVYLIIYVDDLLIMGVQLKTVEEVKKKLSQFFKMTDCGELRHFLGMKIEYDRKLGKMHFSQAASVDKVLKKFRMDECNPTKTPMEKGLQLTCAKTEPVGEPYREVLGSLMYIMMSTRPDICFPVGYLGRYQQQPEQQHWTALKRVVRYMRGTKDMRLEFARDKNMESLVGFADADWAADTADRKSVSGFLFQVYGNTVSWSSKKQTTVATSSSEAEYVALSAGVAEAIWLTGLLGDLGITITQPVTIYEDNRGCIGMAQNLECKRAKHIDIKHHFIRDHIAAGRIRVEPIRTDKQLADIFTKALDVGRFEDLRRNIGLHNREGVKK